MVQVVMRVMGSGRWSFTCSLTTHLLLCSPVPNRPLLVHGLGVGDPHSKQQTRRQSLVQRSTLGTSTRERKGRKAGVNRGRSQTHVDSMTATDTPIGALNDPVELSQVGSNGQDFMCPTDHLLNVSHSRKGVTLDEEVAWNWIIPQKGWQYWQWPGDRFFLAWDLGGTSQCSPETQSIGYKWIT